MRTYADVIKVAVEMFLDRTGVLPEKIELSTGDGGAVRLSSASTHDWMDLTIGGAACDMDIVEYEIVAAEYRAVPFETWQYPSE